MRPASDSLHVHAAAGMAQWRFVVERKRLRVGGLPMSVSFPKRTLSGPSPGAVVSSHPPFMERPRLLPTSATDETFAGVTYHLDGELVPALTIELAAGRGSVFFEHHILLWKHPGVNISIRPMKGAFKRMMAGMQIFITEAQGPG